MEFSSTPFTQATGIPIRWYAATGVIIRSNGWTALWVAMNSSTPRRTMLYPLTSALYRSTPSMMAETLASSLVSPLPL